MITVFRPNGEAQALPTEADSAAADALAGAVWVDLHEPTREEELLIERVLGLEVPTRDELKDIEPSSRLYTDGASTYMTASLIVKAEGDLPHLTDVGFILTAGKLLTVRYAEPRSFPLFKSAMHRIPGGCSSSTVMITRLLETIADRTAEILEIAVARADQLSLEVFGENRHLSRRPPRYLEDRVVQVSALHRLLAKARDSLMSLSRMLTFLHALPALQSDRVSLELCRTVQRDVQSLLEHANFVAGNITFLLDASLGLISLEQNAIIKIFSIASVVLLPPTLIASIYGMNFEFMPELRVAYAYPLTVGAMVLSAILPFFFFRWKGWL
ncbi:magnesium transporter CorA family protein [Shinella sp. CPCC 101442]|uniref:magnesium transporter CorA family protein n=1 Tax=Shinella sp. CPCC 101442 TaxID=2932265 RepID=UPI0027E42262|nr:magnesium transporter CorA family protein [Shinella sp. CPCC 101442]